MKVYFIGSRGDIVEEIDHYRAAIKAIEKTGSTVMNKWIEDVYDMARKKGETKKDNEDWEKIDRDNEAAMFKADVVVVEGTARDFFSGYQVAQAVHFNKPILVLTRDSSPMAISGLSMSWGFNKSVYYEPDALDQVIADFIDDNTIETKDLRFNFFLDRPTYNHLRWMSSNTGKTKAQIVRDLLQQQMQEAED